MPSKYPSIFIYTDSGQDDDVKCKSTISVMSTKRERSAKMKAFVLRRHHFFRCVCVCACVRKNVYFMWKIANWFLRCDNLMVNFIFASISKNNIISCCGDCGNGAIVRKCEFKYFCLILNYHFKSHAFS